MSEEKTKGVVLPVGPPSEDGSFRAVLLSDDGVGVGHFVPAEDGSPVLPGAQLVNLSARDGSPALDLEVLYEAPGAPRPSGPAMVNSRAYRSGWDAVFGGDKSKMN